MKKLLLLLIALCAAGIVLLTWLGDGEEPEEAAAVPSPEASQEPAGETGEKNSGVDYKAIYALHEPEEIVMTVDGTEVPWQEYFYYVYYLAESLENGFQQLMYSGESAGWESPADEEGNSYAALLCPGAEWLLRRDLALEALAEENGVRLTEEDEADIQAAHQEDLEYLRSLGYRDEQLFQVLQARYINETIYWRLLRLQVLEDACYRELVGADGEKLTERQVLDWMEAQGCISIDRIRIPTVDAVTGQSLPPEAIAGQAAVAEELSLELRSVEDPAEREALFLEKKALYDPNGLSYVATAEWVDPAIYAVAAALEPGQVSEVLELDGSYYVILRRPLSAEDEISTTYSRDTARWLMAGEGVEPLLETRMAAQQLSYAPGFEPPDILDFYTRPSYGDAN